MAALLMATACSSPESEAIRVGVILDYTGDASATGFNLERAGLLAARSVRAARPGETEIQCVFGDSQGDPERAAEVAREFVAQGVVAVIGPAGDELVSAAATPLEEAGVPLISPIATNGDADAVEPMPWFRLAPSHELLSENLAKAVYERGISRVGIVRAPDVYHERLASVFSAEFIDLGGEVALDVPLGPTDPLTDAVQAIEVARDQGVSGFVVALNALPAARLITEVAIAQDTVPQWFLTPRVKSDVFIINTPASAIEGAIGISPNVFLVDSPAFIQAYGDAWTNDVPFEDSYFMYDATALLLLSIDRALRMNGTVDRGSLEAALFDTAATGGVQVEWNGLADAIQWNSVGRGIQYTGVTGPLLFAPNGQRRSGKTTVWTIRERAIVNLE